MDDNEQLNEIAGRFIEHMKAEVDKGANPGYAAIGAFRGSVVVWMSCVEDGARTDALNLLRDAINEEIDNLVRGIANGMIPG